MTPLGGPRYGAVTPKDSSVASKGQTAPAPNEATPWKRVV